LNIDDLVHVYACQPVKRTTKFNPNVHTYKWEADEVGKYTDNDSTIRKLGEGLQGKECETLIITCLHKYRVTCLTGFYWYLNFNKQGRFLGETV